MAALLTNIYSENDYWPTITASGSASNNVYVNYLYGGGSVQQPQPPFTPPVQTGDPNIAWLKRRIAEIEWRA